MRPGDAFYNIVLAKIISIYIALGKKTGVEIFQPTTINSIVEHFPNKISLFSLSSGPLKASSSFLIIMVSFLCFSSPGGGESLSETAL